jgi:hypothetical protein
MPLSYQLLYNSVRAWRIARIQRSNNSITCSGCKDPDRQRLYGSVEAGPLCFDGDIVLHKTKCKQDHSCDPNRDKQSMCDIRHGKIGYHWNQAACHLKVSRRQRGVISELLVLPMKYANPIVPAEIQARETLGFSSRSSKFIINYSLVKSLYKGYLAEMHTLTHSSTFASSAETRGVIASRPTP